MVLKHTYATQRSEEPSALNIFMAYTKQQLWQRFRKYYLDLPQLGLSLDISRMNFPDELFTSANDQLQKAFSNMEALEKGAIANPDENRMVGHYWLRNPSLAP